MWILKVNTCPSLARTGFKCNVFWPNFPTEKEGSSVPCTAYSKKYQTHSVFNTSSCAFSEGVVSNP